MAYDFPINRISGPDWLFDDVVTTVGDFRLMVQNPGTSIFDAVNRNLG